MSNMSKQEMIDGIMNTVGNLDVASLKYLHATSEYVFDQQNNMKKESNHNKEQNKCINKLHREMIKLKTDVRNMHAMTLRPKSNTLVPQANPLVINRAIDVNNATLTTLKTLKGVGDKNARAIISYRQTHGRIQSKEQLVNIQGMSYGIICKNENDVNDPINFIF
jgi:competence ComEA-like helix-hairpin-helix protein